MIDIIIKVFCGLNVLAGLYFIAQAFWPVTDPADAKSVALVVVYLVWGFTFIGLAVCLFLRKSFARIWVMVLYGLVGLVIVMSLIGEFRSNGKYIFYYPIRYAFTYLIWLTFSIGPVVFMLRRDVKEYFSAVEKTAEDKG